MSVSVFSYLSSMLMAIILFCSMNIWMKFAKESNYQPGLLLITMLLPIIRLIVVIEFPYTVELESNSIYPLVYDAFTEDLVTIYGEEISISSLIGLFWIGGALICIYRQLISYKHILSAIKLETPLSRTFETKCIDEFLAEKGRRKHNVHIVHSFGVTEPMIYGLSQPTIVLPIGNLTDQEITLIIKHELGHYINGDLFTKLWLEIICAFYWWLPFVKSLKKKIYYMMEIRADLIVIENQCYDLRIVYLKTLLKLSKQKKLSSINGVLSIPLFTYGTLSDLKKRFSAIAVAENNRHHIFKSIFLAIVSIALYFSSYFFVLQPRYNVKNIDDDAFVITHQDYSFIACNDGGYNLYDNMGNFMAWVPEIPSELSNIKVNNN